MTQTRGAQHPETLLRSYVSGNWHTPPGEGRALLDAVTGDEVARISSEGVDFGAALDYGRTGKSVV